MTAPTELLPCPFCGSTGEAYHRSSARSWVVVCDDCNAEMLGASEVEVVTAWNRRVPASEAGWLPIETAPQDIHVLLDLGETIPDLVDARVGQYVSEYHAAQLGESLSASGGWIIWNSGSDWFVIPFHDAHGWRPLPAAPDRRAGK